MLFSFFKRALAPQLVFLVAIPLVNELLPVRPDQATGENMGNALLRTLAFVLGGGATWLLALVLTGYFLPGEPPRPSAAPKPPPKPSDGPPEGLWLTAVLSLPFVAIPLLIAGAFLSLILYWLWLAQFVVFLLYCIRLFNVFSERLGASVVEGIERGRVEALGRQERRKKERQRERSREKLTARIREVEDEAKKLEASPLDPDVTEPSILRLRSQARDLKQELDVLDSVGDDP